MKYTETELENTLQQLASIECPHKVDVVDSVMGSLQAAQQKEQFSIKKERRIRWTIGTNTNSSQAQNENDTIAKFISEVYNQQHQADVVFYTPDYIDILLGVDESL